MEAMSKFKVELTAVEKPSAEVKIQKAPCK